MEDWTLTTSEVAKLIGRSRHTVKRYGRDGKLSSMRVGSGQRLYSLADVERFIDERRIETTRRRSKEEARSNGS